MSLNGAGEVREGRACKIPPSPSILLATLSISAPPFQGCLIGPRGNERLPYPSQPDIHCTADTIDYIYTGRHTHTHTHTRDRDKGKGLSEGRDGIDAGERDGE